MCILPQPNMQAPELPPETAAMRQPDGAAARSSASRRATDRLRGSSQTILTSGSGVAAAAPTEKKTLLGQ